MGLDTRWWNLSFGVAMAAGVGGCGPTVLLPEDDEGIADAGDTGDTGEDDPDTGDFPPDEEGPEPPPPGECRTDSDCEGPYEYCLNGTCEYGGYYCSEGCCDGGCYYGECYADDDCGTGGLCDESNWYGYCYDVLLPLCDGEVPLAEQLVVPTGPDDEIVSLSFVDRDGGGQDLVVGLDGRARVVHSVADQVDIDVTGAGEVIAAASGDLDGDGDRELVLSTSIAGLLVYEPDAMGGYTQVAVELPVLGATDLAIGAFVGEAPDDLLYLADGVVGYVQGVGDGTFGPPSALAEVANGMDRLHTVGWDTGPVIGIDGTLSVTLHSAPIEASPAIVLDLSQRAGEEHTLVSGSRLGETGFVAVRSYGDWALLEAVSGPAVPIGILGALIDARAGDIDGDVDEDFIGRTDGDGLRIALTGSSAQLECQQHLEVTLAASSRWAVGDLDGDGDADIAAGNGAALVIYAPQ